MRKIDNTRPLTASKLLESGRAFHFFINVVSITSLGPGSTESYNQLVIAAVVQVSKLV
jgi:hypothetical protein